MGILLGENEKLTDLHFYTNVNKMTKRLEQKQVSDRLNPNSILICNLALRECGKEVENNPTSLMNHFIEHGWKKIPQLAQEDIDNKKEHPHFNEILTAKEYLKRIKERPDVWWFDNQFIWKDIRNLHFLHKTSKGNRSLRSLYKH